MWTKKSLSKNVGLAQGFCGKIQLSVLVFMKHDNNSNDHWSIRGTAQFMKTRRLKNRRKFLTEDKELYCVSSAVSLDWSDQNVSLIIFAITLSTAKKLINWSQKFKSYCVVYSLGCIVGGWARKH